jgi:hypothetical protein
MHFDARIQRNRHSWLRSLCAVLVTALTAVPLQANAAAVARSVNGEGASSVQKTQVAGARASAATSTPNTVDGIMFGEFGGAQWEYTPVWSPATQSYTLTMPFESSSLTFIAATTYMSAVQYLTASLRTAAGVVPKLDWYVGTLGGIQLVAGGIYSVSAGITGTLTITSFDGAGANPYVYTVNIVRAPPLTKIALAAIGDIEGDQYPFTSSWISTTQAYTAYIASETSKMNFMAITEYFTAVTYMTASLATNAGIVPMTFFTTVKGTEFGNDAIPLAGVFGWNLGPVVTGTMTITSTDLLGGNPRIYTIYIGRLPPLTKIAMAAIGDIETGQQYPFTSDWISTTQAYTAYIASETSKMNLMAITEYFTAVTYMTASLATNAGIVPMTFFTTVKGTEFGNDAIPLAGVFGWDLGPVVTGTMTISSTDLLGGNPRIYTIHIGRLPPVNTLELFLASADGTDILPIEPQFISTTQRHTLTLPYTSTMLIAIGQPTNFDSAGYATATLSMGGVHGILPMAWVTGTFGILTNVVGGAWQMSPGLTGTLYMTTTGEGGRAPRTYEFVIVRADPVNTLEELLVLSDYAQNLVLSPAFVSTTLEYTLTLPHNALNMAVLGLPTDLAASSYATMSMLTAAGVLPPTLWYTDAQASLGSPKPYIDGFWTFAAGLTGTVYITVHTSLNDSPRVYAIHIDRTVPGAGLSALDFAPLQLSPAFTTSQLNYTATVTSDLSSVTITPTAETPGALITVTASPGSCTQPALRGGGAPAGIPCTLEIGENVITVTVTANGTTTEYVIVVTRESQEGTSSDNALSALTISSGALTPAFVSSTTEYAAFVGNDIASLTITAAVNDGGASVSYAASPGSCAPPSSRAAAVLPGVPCTLEVGENVITVTVTAANGDVREYVIVVTRAAQLAVTQMWPNAGVPADGMPVSLFGAGFAVALTVTINGTPVEFTIVDDGRITFAMPAGTAGTSVSVTVQTANATETLADAFTYLAPTVVEVDAEQGLVFTTSNGLVVTVPPQGISGSLVITLTPQPPAPGVPGNILMYAFRLEALLDGAPLATLTNAVTITLPIDEGIFAIQDGERPWLYQWIGGEERGKRGEERGKRSEEREEERSALTSHSSPLTSLSAGRWILVRGQQYDAGTQVMTVALRPMGEYALSTSLVRSYWVPLVPVLR